MGDYRVLEGNILGQEIRRLRNLQNATIQHIADKCECSKSLISKIENGKVIPSVAMLVRIASSLGTSVSELLEENNPQNAVNMTWDEVKENFVPTEKGYEIFAVATHHRDKRMQPFFFKVRRGQVKRHKVRHEGEEFIFVVEGSIYFQVAHTQYLLHQGDSLYFNAAEEHFVSPHSEEAIYIDIFI